MTRGSCLAFAALAMGIVVQEGFPEEGKPNERPVVLMTIPLAIPRGSTTRVTLRGQRLDGATMVKSLTPGVEVKIVGQGNAAVPNTLKSERVGDRQIEVELTVPAIDATKPDGAGGAGEVELVVVTPKGESKPFAVLVGGEFPVVEEKEPNDGFAQAQPVVVPSIVNGAIHDARNVDVFAVEAKAGERLIVEVIAARRGSALDALLMLYDARGTVIAQNDDSPGTTDARLDVTLKAAGRYSLVVQDANDLGGVTHPYRLVVRSATK